MSWFELIVYMLLGLVVVILALGAGLGLLSAGITQICLIFRGMWRLLTRWPALGRRSWRPHRDDQRGQEIRQIYRIPRNTPPDGLRNHDLKPGLISGRMNAGSFGAWWSGRRVSASTSERPWRGAWPRRYKRWRTRNISRNYKKV
jgi:hypothetical protein